jgi:hypothetical protein
MQNGARVEGRNSRTARIVTAYVASWFETCGVAALLTMTV